MPQPSQLAISVNSLLRLLKEEKSYHKELAEQQSRIEKAEEQGTGENAEYQLKQERRALEETKAVFGPLHNRISDAAARLDEQIDYASTMGKESEESITEAKGVLEQARAEKEE